MPTAALIFAITSGTIALISAAAALWRTSTAFKLWQQHVNDRLTAQDERLQTIEETLTTNNGGSTVRDKLDKVLRRLGVDPEDSP